MATQTVSAKALTWNDPNNAFTMASTNSMAENVVIDADAGDGQLVLVFSNTHASTYSYTLETGSGFWMHGQGTTASGTVVKGQDHQFVGPLEGGRFRQTDGTINITMDFKTNTSNVKDNGYVQCLKVPKG